MTLCRKINGLARMAECCRWEFKKCGRRQPQGVKVAELGEGVTASVWGLTA
jgi:hypothetical protein